MFKRLTNWVAAFARHKHATTAMALVSFSESSFFPVPPDVMLAPMVLANRKHALRLGTICTIASTLGAAFGYFIGVVLFEQIGQPILDSYNAAPAFEKFLHFYTEWGFWIVLISAVSFIPFKIATIASGVVSLNPFIFILACFIGRGFRFYSISLLMTARPSQWLSEPKQHLTLLWSAMAGIITLVLILEHIGGIKPCAMCLAQRWPYYIGLIMVPILFLLYWRGQNRLYEYGLAALSVMLCAGASYGFYHAGIEWQWWGAHAGCSAPAARLSSLSEWQNALAGLQNAPIPRCDEAGFRLFGISLAGYNALAGFGLALFAFWPLYRKRQNKNESKTG